MYKYRVSNLKFSGLMVESQGNLPKSLIVSSKTKLTPSQAFSHAEKKIKKQFTHAVLESADVEPVKKSSVNEALLGWSHVQDGSYTINQMGVEIAQSMIVGLEKVKAAFENERGAEAMNINSTWGSVVEDYHALRGYLKKAFGVNHRP